MDLNSLKMATMATDKGKDKDEDDNHSTSSAQSLDSTNTGLVSQGELEERDEIEEVRRGAEKETDRVRFWRFVVAGALLATALAVSLAAYFSLQQGEIDKYERAFHQFSATIAISVTDHQKNVRMAYANAAGLISSAAYVSNATWPYYTFPRFEQLAYNTRFQSKTEVLLMAHLVQGDNRTQWVEYADQQYLAWVDQGYLIESKREGPQVYNNSQQIGYQSTITKVTPEGFVQEENKTHYWVAWTYSPPPFTYKFINWDFTGVPDYDNIIKAAVILKDQTLFTRVRNYVSADVAFTKAQHEAMHSQKLASVVSQLPHSIVFHPVHRDPDNMDSEVVAVLAAGMAWDAALLDVLPQDAKGILVVIKNNCNQSYTFQLDGPDAFYLGDQDLHDVAYDNKEFVIDLTEGTSADYTEVQGHCMYTMYVYPTKTFQDTWDTNNAEYMAIIIACTFFLVIVVFFVYDMFVQRRNEKLVENAARSNAIVTSLFPSNIRDKLMERDSRPAGSSNNPSNLKAFMVGNHADNTNVSSPPMADLFLETTIMFADIVGFTAWASVREPCHVFTLLETLYSAFDDTARKRRVFKVETVGDCYVAATGMPDARKDHAVAMCRFARDIMKEMGHLTKQLELTLGPDTADLDLRIGIHSGPVTAGVLRGEKARFQLFGDTMNTTARIESNGMPGRIHLSQETADCLISVGKEHWLEKRDEMIEAKGKGLMQTFWLGTAIDKRETSSRTGDESCSNADDDVEIEQENVADAKTRRLIEWNVESLLRILKQIIAAREAKERQGVNDIDPVRREEFRTLNQDASFLDEVREIISLPEFDEDCVNKQKTPDEIQVGTEVVEELRDYVTCIASMYRANSFHNFEHASHVTMSVLKLLSRIVAPSDLDSAQDSEAATLHDHTYGITSDPLTQFACALAALIHDVDHSGAPNAQLVKERASVAAAYNDRSVAEQNSLALAWSLLMDDQFRHLRATIYIDVPELERFRQLVVNAVMATDIVDKDLKALRNNRWDKAFSTTQQCMVDNPRDAINRKATIVIEHLIQASDVAHTMQHWHIYRKWNERFFKECYVAFLHGRAERDPSEGWYSGEIGFFDFYIIPLAKKLQDCGVFGKSSDEYLNYATKNRQEWEVRGQEIVAEMLQSAAKEFGGARPKRRMSLK